MGTSDLRLGGRPKKPNRAHPGRVAGAWRAFCRQKLIADAGKGDFAAYAAEYAVLNEAERLELQRMGQVGIAQRLGGAPTSFGAKPSRTRFELAISAREACLDTAAEALQCAEGASAFAARARLAGQRYQETIQWAHAAARHATKQIAAKRTQRNRDLDSFATSDEARLALARIRSVLDLPGEAKPVPSEIGVALEVSPGTAGKADILRRATRLASFLGTSSAHTPGAHKFLSMLMKFWKDVNKPVTRAEAPRIPSSVRNDVECRKAGMCICKGGPGYTVYQVRNSVYASLKAYAPANSNARRLLVHGCFVLRFTCAPEADDTADARHDEVVLHIGLHYLSPFRSTFQRLLMAANPVGEPPPDHRRLYVQARCVLTWFDARGAR